MGPQGEEVVEATGLAARLSSAIVDIEVRIRASLTLQAREANS